MTLDEGSHQSDIKSAGYCLSKTLSQYRNDAEIDELNISHASIEALLVEDGLHIIQSACQIDSRMVESLKLSKCVGKKS